MSDTFEQSIVSLLEEHVEHAITTVQQLGEQKLQLETEIASLNSAVAQRDAQIQELENEYLALQEELDNERSSTSVERSKIRERLVGLMDALNTSEASHGSTETESVIDFEEAESGSTVTFEAAESDEESDAADSEPERAVVFQSPSNT